MARLAAVDDHAANIDLLDLEFEVFDFILQAGHLLLGQAAQVVLHVIVALLLRRVARLSYLNALGKQASLVISQAVVEVLEIGKGHRLLFYFALIIGHLEVDLFLSLLFNCRAQAVLPGLAVGYFKLISLRDDPRARVLERWRYRGNLVVDSLDLRVDGIGLRLGSGGGLLVRLIEFLILGRSLDFRFRLALPLLRGFQILSVP